MGFREITCSAGEPAGVGSHASEAPDSLYYFSGSRVTFESNPKGNWRGLILLIEGRAGAKVLRSLSAGFDPKGGNGVSGYPKEEVRSLRCPPTASNSQPWGSQFSQPTMQQWGLATRGHALGVPRVPILSPRLVFTEPQECLKYQAEGFYRGEFSSSAAALPQS